MGKSSAQRTMSGVTFVRQHQKKSKVANEDLRRLRTCMIFSFFITCLLIWSGARFSPLLRNNLSFLPGIALPDLQPTVGLMGWMTYLLFFSFLLFAGSMAVISTALYVKLALRLWQMQHVTLHVMSKEYSGPTGDGSVLRADLPDADLAWIALQSSFQGFKEHLAQLSTAAPDAAFDFVKRSILVLVKTCGAASKAVTTFMKLMAEEGMRSTRRGLSDTEHDSDSERRAPSRSSKLRLAQKKKKGESKSKSSRHAARKHSSTHREFREDADLPKPYRERMSSERTLHDEVVEVLAKQAEATSPKVGPRGGPLRPMPALVLPSGATAMGSPMEQLDLAVPPSSPLCSDSFRRSSVEALRTPRQTALSPAPSRLRGDPDLSPLPNTAKTLDYEDEASPLQRQGSLPPNVKVPPRGWSTPEEAPPDRGSLESSPLRPIPMPLEDKDEDEGRKGEGGGAAGAKKEVVTVDAQVQCELLKGPPLAKLHGPEPPASDGREDLDTIGREVAARLASAMSKSSTPLKELTKGQDMLPRATSDLATEASRHKKKKLQRSNCHLPTQREQPLPDKLMYSKAELLLLRHSDFVPLYLMESPEHFGLNATCMLVNELIELRHNDPRGGSDTESSAMRRPNDSRSAYHSDRGGSDTEAGAGLKRRSSFQDMARAEPEAARAARERIQHDVNTQLDTWRKRKQEEGPLRRRNSLDNMRQALAQSPIPGPEQSDSDAASPWEAIPGRVVSTKAARPSPTQEGGSARPLPKPSALHKDAEEGFGQRKPPTGPAYQNAGERRGWASSDDEGKPKRRGERTNDKSWVHADGSDRMPAPTAASFKTSSSDAHTRAWGEHSERAQPAPSFGTVPEHSTVQESGGLEALAVSTSAGPAHFKDAKKQFREVANMHELMASVQRHDIFGSDTEAGGGRRQSKHPRALLKPAKGGAKAGTAAASEAAESGYFSDDTDEVSMMSPRRAALRSRPIFFNSKLSSPKAEPKAAEAAAQRSELRSSSFRSPMSSPRPADAPQLGQPRPNLTVWDQMMLEKQQQRKLAGKDEDDGSSNPSNPADDDDDEFKAMDEDELIRTSSKASSRTSSQSSLRGRSFDKGKSPSSSFKESPNASSKSKPGSLSRSFSNGQAREVDADSPPLHIRSSKKITEIAEDGFKIVDSDRSRKGGMRSAKSSQQLGR